MSQPGINVELSSEDLLLIMLAALRLSETKCVDLPNQSQHYGQIGMRFARILNTDGNAPSGTHYRAKHDKSCPYCACN